MKIKFHSDDQFDNQFIIYSFLKTSLSSTLLCLLRSLRTVLSLSISKLSTFVFRVPKSVFDACKNVPVICFGLLQLACSFP